MFRRNRFIVHQPGKHHLRMPQRRNRLVDVVAVGCDETAIMRPRDETQHVGEIGEPDAGLFHDTVGVRRAALQEKGV